MVTQRNPSLLSSSLGWPRCRAFLLFEGFLSLYAVLIRFKRHRSRPRPAYAAAVEIQTGSPPALERKEQCHAPCDRPSADTRTLSSRRCSMLLLVRTALRRSSNLLRAACWLVSFDSTRSCDRLDGWTVPEASTRRCCTLMLGWFAKCSRIAIVTVSRRALMLVSST